MPQLGRKGSVPARSNSGAPKRSSCSLKQQLLISQADHGEQSLDTFPKNVQNLSGVLNGFFPQNQKSETERLRRAQLSVCLSLSLQGAPLAPLPPLLCDSRLPSPLSTRASVTKGVVLRAAHRLCWRRAFCLIQQFPNYDQEATSFKSTTVHYCPNIIFGVN